MWFSFFDLWCKVATYGQGGGGGAGGGGGGGGGSVTSSVPEFDGPGAIAAAALIISVAAVLYDKAKK